MPVGFSDLCNDCLAWDERSFSEISSISISSALFVEAVSGFFLKSLSMTSLLEYGLHVSLLGEIYLATFFFLFHMRSK